MRKNAKQVREDAEGNGIASGGISASTRSQTQNSALTSSESQIQNDCDDSAHDSAPDERCHCGETDCNFSVIEENDHCLQCAYCKDFVLLRCLGSDSGTVFDFVQRCAGLVYSCPGCRAEALPNASAAGLAKVDRKVDMLLGLLSPASCTGSVPDYPLGSDWPPLEEAGAYAAKKNFPKRPSIPSLSNAVEVALERREQKDCLVLSGVQDLGDDRKDFKSATTILKQLKISSNPVRTFRMGSVGKKGQPKLLKVQLHSSHDRNQALRNTRELANTEFAKVFVRPSLSADERKRLKDLMKERWERKNRGDYCYIDWSSLSLKRSKKSPMHPEFIAPKSSSEVSAVDLLTAPTSGHLNSTAISNAAPNSSNPSADSGN